MKILVWRHLSYFPPKRDKWQIMRRLITRKVLRSQAKPTSVVHDDELQPERPDLIFITICIDKAWSLVHIFQNIMKRNRDGKFIPEIRYVNCSYLHIYKSDKYIIIHNVALIATHLMSAFYNYWTFGVRGYQIVSHSIDSNSPPALEC